MTDQPESSVTREPLELAPQEDLDAYASMLGLDREIVARARKCPDCEQAIIVCDNGWLDAKATPDGDCGMMALGPLVMLFGGGEISGSRHRLHQHQPRED